MNQIRAAALLTSILLLPGFAAGASAQFVHTVSNEFELSSVIADLGPGDSIVFLANITLSRDLPSIAQDTTIVGNGFTLSGADQFRGLVIAAFDEQFVPLPVQVTVQDLTITRTVAAGDVEGGAGLGGAIFVASQASVTLRNVAVVSNQAVGGDGGPEPGGSAFGGAVFVEGDGSLLVAGGVTINGNSVTGGPGTPVGAAHGAGLFLDGNGVITFDIAAGLTSAVSDQIADGLGTGGFGAWALQKDGAGALVLTGTNLYSGGTTVSAGTLQVNGSAAVGSGTIGLMNAATLSITGSTTFAQDLFLDDTPLIAVSGGQSVTWTGAIHDGETAGQLRLGGGGTLSLTNAGNTYTGGTFVLGGSTLFVADDGALGGLAGGVTLGDASTSGTLAVATGNAMNTARAISLGPGGGIFDTQGTASLTLRGSVSGAGSLTKNGSGTLVLAATNAYAGPTRLNGGITRAAAVNVVNGAANLNIQAGALFDLAGFDQTAGSLSGSGNIDLGAGTLTAGDDNSSTSFLGEITGAGALVKTGTGSLTLAGPNTYSGGTTVAGGTLIGTSTSLLGNIINHARVVFDQSADGVFAGVMEGSGELLKTGAGTLTLERPLFHTGGTLVNDGTLAAGAAGVFGGSISLGGGTLAFNGFDQSIDTLSGNGTVALGSARLTTGGGGTDAVLTGEISGSGSLVKVGGGTLTLTGANSYSGGTTVSDGALVGTTTSLQGDILNDALVAFDQSDDGTYAGSMRGSGSLAKLGAGTLTLTGNNSYTGATFITAGTLAGSASSLTGPIFNDASLVFTGDADGTFDGTLAGGGSVIKTGLGTLSLTGSHPMSGLFSVGQGTLSLAGSLGGSISVQPGARLLAASPPSTFGMDTAALAASTGNRVNGEPLMVIGGNLSLRPGSIFSLPIGLGPVPSVLVVGTAVIDQAELEIVPLDIGTQRTTSFIGLTALNGLSVTGATASSQNPLLQPFLRQDANSLYVTLLNLGVPLANAASTGNAASVGTAIDRFKLDASGDRAFIVRELAALDDGALNDALRLIAGEVHASSLQVAIRDGEAFTDMIRGELASRNRESSGVYFAPGDNVRWWSQIGGEHGTFDGAGAASGGTVNAGTGAGGFDWRLSDRWVVGGGAGFGLGRLALRDVPASTDFKAPRAFGYAGFRPRGIGLKVGGSFARSTSKTDRNIAFAATLPPDLGGAPLTDGVNRDARAEEIALISDQWTEYDDDMDVKTYRLEWFVGLRRAEFGRQGFSETGAGALSLLLPDQTLELRQADVKVHLWRRERDVRPFFEALYRREMTSGNTTTRLEFVDVPDSGFTVEGLPVPGHTVSGRAGVTLMTWLGAWTFEYQARYATGQFAHAGDVRIRFK